MQDLKDILSEIDEAILSAPKAKPFEYVPVFGRIDALTPRQEEESPQSESQHVLLIETHGHIEFNNGMFKVLNEKQHLIKFKAKLIKNFKAKKDPKSLPKKPLPSNKSCVLNMIKDNQLMCDDPDSYYRNIYMAGELSGLIFYSGVKMNGDDNFIEPNLINAHLHVNDREFVVVNGLQGWNVRDLKTGLGTVAMTDNLSKTEIVKTALSKIEEFDFDINKIIELETINSQAQLKARYCAVHNIEDRIDFL